MGDLICIVCPKGCRLQVEEGETITVHGHGCVRGEAYAISETRNPLRVLTSTVAVLGSAMPRCPVKTAGGIPKKMLFAAMEEIDRATLTAPVAGGAIIIRDLCGTGINVVATRDIPAGSERM